MPDGVRSIFGDGSALGSVGVTSGVGIGACALMRICAHAVLGVGGVLLNAIAIHVFRKRTCGTWFVNGITRDAMHAMSSPLCVIENGCVAAFI